jgi:two-component system, cell cycle sensor histidine kinase and response regulator CckA
LSSIDTQSESDTIPATPTDILVADDDAAVGGLVATILRAKGYRVLEARSGEEALEHVEDGLALVIADLVMPPNGGVELADTLRRRVPGLKVLFISGYGVLPGSTNSRDPLLGKPFAPADLIGRVAELIGPSTATPSSGSVDA